MLSLSTTTLLLRKWSKSLLCFFPVKTNVMQWLHGLVQFKAASNNEYQKTGIQMD